MKKTSDGLRSVFTDSAFCVRCFCLLRLFGKLVSAGYAVVAAFHEDEFLDLVAEGAEFFLFCRKVGGGLFFFRHGGISFAFFVFDL